MTSKTSSAHVDCVFGSIHLRNIFDPFGRLISNTALMDLLRRLRDENAPFELEHKHWLLPKHAKQDAFLQRLRKIAPASSVDPKLE